MCGFDLGLLDLRLWTLPAQYNRTRDEDASVNDAGDGNSGDGDPAAGDAPEISIITPCYNAVRHLRDAIESVALTSDTILGTAEPLPSR